MPVYIYYCAKCQQDFDVEKPVKEIEKPARCPNCRSVKTKRVIRTAAQVRLKGGGWGGKHNAD